MLHVSVAPTPTPRAVRASWESAVIQKGSSGCCASWKRILMALNSHVLPDLSGPEAQHDICVVSHRQQVYYCCSITAAAVGLPPAAMMSLALPGRGHAACCCRTPCSSCSPSHSPS